MVGSVGVWVCVGVCGMCVGVCGVGVWRWPYVQLPPPSGEEIVSLVPGRVKPMSYKIDTCRFLAWRSALLE